MEIISLNMAKDFLRIHHSDEDANIKAIISSCVNKIDGMIKKPMRDYATLSVSDIPLQLRQACLLLIAQSHEHGLDHERPLPMLVEALLIPY